MKIRGVWKETSESYVAELMRVTPTAANVSEYCAIVRDKALMRNLAGAADQINEMVYEGSGEAETMIDEEVKHIFDDAARECERILTEHRDQLIAVAEYLLEHETMGKRTNTILQAAFFSLAKVLPEKDAVQYMKDAATHSYLKKGQDVVDTNHKAIDLGATAYKKVEIPASWADAGEDGKDAGITGRPATVKMVEDILQPMEEDEKYTFENPEYKKTYWHTCSHIMPGM